MTAAVAGAVMGRPSAALLADRLQVADERVADLQDELHAMTAERDALRLELIRLRDLLTYAFGIDGWHIALNVRDRLATLTTRLDRQSAA